MEGINGSNSRDMLERKTRPQEKLNCPRCNSTNTKFCYYNNYSLTQPRYFCKACRRYWTAGGTLRNVPVGGSSRKNKRSILSTSTPKSASMSSNKLSHDLNNNNNQNHPPSFSQFLNPFQSCNKTIHDGGDLSLAFPAQPETHPAMELLRAEMAKRGLNSIVSAVELPQTNGILSSCSSGLPLAMQEMKATLNFSLDGIENNGSDSTARIFFPFRDQLKQLQSTSTNDVPQDHQNKGQLGTSSSGFWSGMLNEGSW